MRCKVQYCEKYTKKLTLGYCSMHYHRMWRHGTTDDSRVRIPEISDTIGMQTYLKSKIIIDKKTGCWLWQGTKEKKGYGVLGKKKKQYRVHRVSAYCFSGTEMDPSMFICHRCDVKNCINPDHLFSGTHQDNMDDGKMKNRFSHGESHRLSKLKESDIHQIRKSILLGKSCSSIAREYDMDPSTICDIKNGVIWSHVPFVDIPK